MVSKMLRYYRQFYERDEDGNYTDESRAMIKYGAIRYRSSDFDSSLSVENPDKLTKKQLMRNRILMDELLQCGDLETARKITAAYPQLRVEYTDDISRREKEIRKQRSEGQRTKATHARRAT